MSGSHHVALLLTAIAAGIAVWFAQISGRVSVLVWDEAQRVLEGQYLALCIEARDGPCAWTWLHNQVFYPFIMPLMHGLLLVSGFDPLPASYLPALIAYCLTGLLAAHLVRTLGASSIGAWSAALLYWTVPISARLAAWGATENVAGALYMLLLISLARLERSLKRQWAIAAGALAAPCWFLKYDYGIVAFGTLAAFALLAICRHDRAVFRRQLWALASGAAPICLWLAFNAARKVDMVREFVGQGVSYRSPTSDVGYYVIALFENDEVGLSPLVALLFASSVFYAGFAWARGRLSGPTIVLLILAFVLYSTSLVKHARYLGSLAPMFAVLAGWTISDCITRLKGSLNGLAIQFPVAALLVWQIGVQVVSAESRFWFINPDPSVPAALEFIAAQVASDDRAVLMIGNSNAVSTGAIALTLSRKANRLPPEIMSWNETLPTEIAELYGKLRTHNVSAIVAVFADDSTVLSDPTLSRLAGKAPSFDDFAQADSLGLLRLRDDLTLAGGRIRVAVWDVPRSHP